MLKPLFLMSESDSVVVRALVSHPVDQGSNLASATLFFCHFQIFPQTLRALAGPLHFQQTRAIEGPFAKNCKIWRQDSNLQSHDHINSALDHSATQTYLRM